MRVLLDSITPGAFKGTPSTDALAGYVGGTWPDFAAIKEEYPNHDYFSYAVNNTELADCLDCETGDATPAEVIPWIKWAHSKGVWRPACYASLSTFEGGLYAAMSRALPRAMYRLVQAHYDGIAEVPAGYDGKQYTDHGPHGENYDQCVVLNDFFPVAAAPVKRLHRTWKHAVKAEVTFDTLTGKWTVKG